MSSVRFSTNVGLADASTNNQTSTLCEPTAAAFNDELFVTGNTFASRSTDGGATWTFVDPFTSFPASAGGFCCDQIVLHERSRNIWFWLLQYRSNAGENIVRLAMSTSGRPENWTYWDLAPSQFGHAAGNAWFDYPDLACTANQLYLTLNVFDSTAAENFIGSLIVRFPLDAFIQRQLTWQYYNITDFGSLHLARGCEHEMFFASNRGANPIRLYRWGDGHDARMTWVDINASQWTGLGTYSSTGPDGTDWMSRVDSRIMGGWRIGNHVGFAWTANADASRPHPYVKTIVVDTTNNSVVAQPDLWSSTHAYAYPSTWPAPDNRVGLSVVYGGGGLEHPAHVVGFLEGNQWVLARAANSTHGPSDGFWGDYVWCALHDPNNTEWVAAGMTLQGGGTRDDMEPRFVRFGVGP